MAGKRKLPSLDSTFTDSEKRPTDDPNLHQGRIRKQQHVEGQWACHIYLELLPSELFQSTIESAITIVSKKCEQSIHSHWSSSSSLPVNSKNKTEESFHISLSRPLTLQFNQLDTLKREIGKVTREFAEFKTSYATFTVLENDELTRRFLCIEIGQGYPEMKGIVDRINEVLKKLRLETYYENPRFHTSIAWSLLNPLSKPLEDEQEDNAKRRKVEVVSNGEEEQAFSEKELEVLNEKLGERFRAEEVWVDSVCLKIGKDVIRFKLL